MYRFPDDRLLIFARPAVPGRCKSRLAAGVGNANAARYYRLMLHSIVRRMATAQLAPVELWCSENPRHPSLLQCRSRYGVALKKQCAGDLGQKMQHALASTLQRSNRVILIGSDCAALLATHIETAFLALEPNPSNDSDHVIIPANDGGYVLVGSRVADGRPFRDINWGSPAVLDSTRRRVMRHGLSLTELSPLWDVDDASDWRRARDAGLIDR